MKSILAIFAALILLSGCSDTDLEKTAAPPAPPMISGTSSDGAKGLEVEGTVTAGDNLAESEVVYWSVSGTNSAGETVTLVQFKMTFTDETDGTEDAKLEILTMQNGTLTEDVEYPTP